MKCPFIETSSRTGINIKKAVKLLLCEINKQENNFDKKKFHFMILQNPLYKINFTDLWNLYCFYYASVADWQKWF